jgi:hypothetical protein
MKNLLAAIALGVFALTPCGAIMDQDVEWNSFAIRVEVERQQIEITAATTADRLSRLEIRTGRNRVTVPPEELVGIPPVLLRTLRVVVPDTQIRPGANLRLEFQLVPLRTSEHIGTAKFAFAGGRYSSWFVERRVDGKLVTREMKEVGRTPQPVK